jgi:hypothetical protein
MVGGRISCVLAEEGRVNVDDGGLLTFRESTVGTEGADHIRVGRLLVEQSRLDVQRLRRDAQTARDLREDLRTGPTQAAFDLRQVRIGHARQASELSDGDLRLVALLANVTTEIVNNRPGHTQMLTDVLAKVSGVAARDGVLWLTLKEWTSTTG